MPTRRFTLEFTLEGPVHIGNGNEYGKKDYFETKGKIAVLNLKEFTSKLSNEQLCEYLEYLRDSSSRMNLQEYLKKHKLTEKAEESVAYSVKSNLAKARRGAIQYHDVAEFIKDAHGCPYIPGSSVKGMLRTAIETCIIFEKPELAKCYDHKLVCKKNARNADAKLDKQTFWVEQPIKNDSSVKNDIMKYVSVADSAPLSCEGLVFAKKYDRFCKKDGGWHKRDFGGATDRAGNALNIYRECLRPGTQFYVDVDVDERIDEYLPFKLDAKGIQEVIKRFHELYEKCFLSNFDTNYAARANGDGMCQYVIASGPLAGMRCRNHAVKGTNFCNKHQGQTNSSSNHAPSDEMVCYLGGGVDFNSKTVMNALFKENDDRVSEIANVLYAQFPTKLDIKIYDKLAEKVERAGFTANVNFRARHRNGKLQKGKEDHRHWRDLQFGVAPHTLKMGQIDDEMLPMGKCKLKIKERR